MGTKINKIDPILGQSHQMLSHFAMKCKTVLKDFVSQLKRSILAPSSLSM
jgi:hypothetical protein